MYEKIKQPLATRRRFAARLLRNITLGLIATAIALWIGMYGYHHYEKMNWIDAFSNAAMILSGMGPFGPLQTNGGKIFAGLYALFSGLFFIMVMGLILTPIVHRFFHKMHLEEEGQRKS